MDEGSAARHQGLRLVPSDNRRDEVNTTPSGVVSTFSASIRPGVVVNGKYLVGSIIGEGGVGIVYEAQNLELDEKVALKCLRPEMLTDTSIVARFAHEAKAAASIKSEYVATVHDVGTMPDGAPYIVMEFLEGKDLGAFVQERGVLGPRAASEYALQVCEALAVAHSKGIIHRDIKPENLMLTERAGGMRIVKVLDFGISKAALTGSIFRNDLPLLKTVNLMGTPLYMSPEQIRNTDSVDVRSDIWSLGMVLYELLTCTTAFAGQSNTEVCASILEAEPQHIEIHRKDLPSGLVDVIHRCLEKDPGRRYQNVAELAIALMPFGPKRARLNVERSISVLQGSGMVDSAVRVLSTMPPPNGEYAVDSMPAAPRLPTIPEMSGRPSDVSAVSDAIVPDFRAPDSGRKGRTIAILAALLVVAAVAIGILATRSAAPPPAEASKASEPAPVTAEAATKPSEPIVAASAPAQASPPAIAVAPTVAKPAWMTAPRPATKPTAKTPAPSSSAPIAAPAKTTDEPDLGY